MKNTLVEMPAIFSEPFSLEQQKQLASDITRVVSIYGYITDSYIIEFFTAGLWQKLPCSWQEALHDLPSPMLAALLLEKKKTKDISYRSVWPLSLLALKATAHVLSFPRIPRHSRCEVSGGRPEEFRENRYQSSMLSPLFRKHVKPKKQHEIRQLGKLVKKLSHITGCDHVVDIGSGQGHLSRFLSFGLSLHITAVEADQHLLRMAAKFDQELVNKLQKERERTAKVCTPGSGARRTEHRPPLARSLGEVHASSAPERGGLLQPGTADGALG